MSGDDTQAQGDELQFDRVDTGTAPSDAGVANPAVTCAVCRKPIDTEYYHINDKPVCESCRHAVASAAVTPRGAGPLVRAGLFGLVAAVAGAAIYYAVIAIANLEIGIIAILIGYMVGYAVRKGAGGRGGRRFQILAAVLTYWSVGLAYTPLAFKGMTGGSREETAATRTGDSTRVAAPAGSATVTPPRADSTTSTAADEPISPRSAVTAIAMLFVFVFALPVTAIVGSMPGGLISALIIFIGLRQAWQLTAPPKLDISGPYKVGARASLQPPPTG